MQNKLMDLQPTQIVNFCHGSVSNAHHGPLIESPVFNTSSPEEQGNPHLRTTYSRRYELGGPPPALSPRALYRIIHLRHRHGPPH